MERKYRNTRTGAVITVKTKISGGYWQAVEPAGSSDESNAAQQQSKRKISKNE